jgi:hypothetical protein
MSWVEELDTLPNNFGLQRFRLLMEMTNLQPKHITNKLHPDYSRCWKCYSGHIPDMSIRSLHSHVEVLGKREKTSLQIHSLSSSTV